eukprot:11756400-Prorocentrum_lima.AAC.1
MQLKTGGAGCWMERVFHASTGASAGMGAGGPCGNGKRWGYVYRACNTSHDEVVCIWESTDKKTGAYLGNEVPGVAWASPRTGDTGGIGMEITAFAACAPGEGKWCAVGDRVFLQLSAPERRGAPPPFCFLPRALRDGR